MKGGGHPEREKANRAVTGNESACDVGAWESPSPADEYYVNQEGLFYWMDDAGECDITLEGLNADIPHGCRWCI